MANTYTGTDWKTKTKISTDIMKKMDEGIQENTDLIDSLGGRIYMQTANEEGTYRVIFNTGTSTNNPVVAVIFVRGSNAHSRLLLAVNGYGYGTSRCSTFELITGNYVSYAVSNTDFAIDISMTSDIASSTRLGVFLLMGELKSVEYVAP